jgi:branched-chain amino acid aminotransferase
LIIEHFSRAANGGIGAAKAAGNYAAQFYQLA